MQNIHTALAAQTSNIQTPSIIQNEAAQAGEHIGNVSEAAGKMAVHLERNAVPDNIFFGIFEILLLAEAQRELNDTAVYLLKHAE